MAGIKEAPRSIPEAEQTDVTQVAETPPNPERPQGRSELIIGVIGESWSGSTGIAKALARRLNKPYENGQEYANRRYGIEIGAVGRDIIVDRRMDGWQKKLLRKAVKNVDNPVIETRLFAVNEAEENDVREKEIAEREKERAWKIQKGKDPKTLRPEIPKIPAVAIYVAAPILTRVNRAYKVGMQDFEVQMEAYKSQMEDYEIQQQRILEGEKIPEDELIALPMKPVEPTKVDIRNRMDERKANDLRNFSKIHPNYLPNETSDPFDESLERPDGTPVYHIVVRNPDIPGVSPEEAYERAVDYIIGELPKFGKGAFIPLSIAEIDAIAKENKKKEQVGEDLPPAGDIFDSAVMGENRVKEPKKNGQDKTQEAVIAPSEHQGEPMSKKRFQSGKTRHPNKRHPSNQGREIVA